MGSTRAHACGARARDVVHATRRLGVERLAEQAAQFFKLAGRHEALFDRTFLQRKRSTLERAPTNRGERGTRDSHTNAMYG